MLHLSHLEPVSAQVGSSYVNQGHVMTMNDGTRVIQEQDPLCRTSQARPAVAVGVTLAAALADCNVALVTGPQFTSASSLPGVGASLVAQINGSSICSSEGSSICLSKASAAIGASQ